MTEENNNTNDRVKHIRFAIGDVVKHRMFPFRGVIYDVDPEFLNSEEWWESIPKDIRPRKDQPFYHLLAENDSGPYEAYVSEQNLIPDSGNGPVNHPEIDDFFEPFKDGTYRLRGDFRN